MKTSDGSNWVLFVASPIVMLMLAVPLFGALQRAAHRVYDAEPRRSWSAGIDRIDRAVGRNDVTGAMRAWHDAYTDALRSRGWLPMVEAGNAYLKIGRAAGSLRAAEAKAREAYLIALFRARRDGDVDGLLQVAESFAALGDREVVARCLTIADSVVKRGGDEDARQRVRETAERLSRPVLAGTQSPM